MTATALVVALARPTFDVAYAADQVDAAHSLLDEVGVARQGPREIVMTIDHLDELIDGVDLADVTVVVVLQATFSDASLIVRVWERTRLPLVVWSFPEPRTGLRLRLNSLCGANLAAFSLRRRDAHVCFVHAPADGDGVRRVLGAVERVDLPCAPVDIRPPGPAEPTRLGKATAVRVIDRLSGARVGVVGDAPDGFEPCEYAAAGLSAVTGAVAERIELATLFDTADSTDAATTACTRQRVEAAIEITDAAENRGLTQSLQLYDGLRSLVDDHGWAAVATRCWPECMTDYGGAVCAPQAMLAREGVPAACEADVYGALTSLILQEAAGSTPFLADLVDVDHSDNTSVFWHCGVAASDLAEPGAPIQGVLHPNRGRALLHQFALKSGRVTVARLSQARGELSMVIGSGEMLRRPRAFAGTCGVLHWDEPAVDVLETIFEHGIEHHYGIVYGEHREALVALAAHWHIPVIRLGFGRARTTSRP